MTRRHWRLSTGEGGRAGGAWGTANVKHRGD
jgi:hypothetical protein